ncbi:MAG: signal peptidase I [Clostridia bacterium]|nr:signal peptidase I [Clostridia bacterium]
MADMEIEQPVVPTANSKPLAKDKPEAEDGKKKKTWQRELLEWVIMLVAALVIAFVARSFIFQPVYVDGDSMYPTLHHGEIMFVSKTSYGTSFFGIPFTSKGTYFTVGGEPELFDVVVCNYPGRVDSRGARLNFVKRVVGLPGDTVEIRSGTLYVNNVPYEEKFLHEKMLSDYGPYTVPEGHYFLMGDNRNSSNDSRNPQVGAVARDMIVGRVEGVIWHRIPATLEDSGMKD